MNIIFYIKAFFFFLKSAKEGLLFCPCIITGFQMIRTDPKTLHCKSVPPNVRGEATSFDPPVYNRDLGNKFLDSPLQKYNCRCFVRNLNLSFLWMP